MGPAVKTGNARTAFVLLGVAAMATIVYSAWQLSQGGGHESVQTKEGSRKQMRFISAVTGESYPEFFCILPNPNFVLPAGGQPAPADEVRERTVDSQ